MTLADMARPPADDPVSAVPSWRPGRRLVVAVSLVLLLVAGGTIGATYYYDSVPLAENTVSYPVVSVEELPPTVAHAFVAAVDPEFYESGDSLITRRYTVLAAGAGKESSLRTRIAARKAESAYAKDEILERYLNRARFGPGAVGLVAAARTFFQKPATQLTVAEAALLAQRLDPYLAEPEAGWYHVLDIMVERGWLTHAERKGLKYP